MNFHKKSLVRLMKYVGIALSLSILVNIWWIIVQLYAFSSFADEGIALFGMSLVWLLFLPLLVAPFAFLVSLIGLIFKKTRKISTFFATFLLIFFITGLSSLIISGDIRGHELKKLINRSTVLIEAINNYEKKYNKAPEELGQLVPEFLPSVPTTGIGAYPEYEYTKCESENQCYGNSWMIQVPTFTALINFDSLIYLPNQNYPEEGYGGILKRIEDWAYVYE